MEPPYSLKKFLSLYKSQEELYNPVFDSLFNKTPL